MLRSMRTSVASWSIKIMLGLLIVSFVGFYGWRAAETVQSTHYAAEVDGTKIRARDFDMETEQQLYAYRRLGFLKDDVSDELIQMVRGNVLTGMIDWKLKAARAHKAGVVASREQLRKIIEEQFTLPGTPFDFDAYRRTLSYRYRTTPGDYEELQREKLVARRFDHLLERTAYVSDLELREAYRERNEKVNLWYVTIDPETAARRAGAGAPISRADLEAHYASRADAYKTPETRRIEVAWIDAADLAEPNRADLESTLREEFKPEGTGDATVERIRAAHILFRTTPENEAARKQKAAEVHSDLAKGADFAETARKESEDVTRTEGGDLGYFGRGEMVAEFDDAAFALAPGEISKPVKSGFGFHIIKLTDRIPAGAATPERLKNELRYRWKKKQVEGPGSEKLFESAARILDGLKQRAGPAGLKEAAKDPRIRVASFGPVARTGVLSALPDSEALLRAAFELKPGQVGQPVRGFLSKNSYIVRLVAVSESALPPLESVSEKVRDDLREERKREAVLAYAEELVKRWKKAGKPFALLAKAEGLAVKETGDFTRVAGNEIPGVGRSEKAVAEAFSRSAQDPFLTPVTLEGKTHLLSLKRRTDPDWKLFEDQREELRKTANEEAGRERVTQWTDALRAGAKIRRYYGQPAGKRAPGPPPDYPY